MYTVNVFLGGDIREYTNLLVYPYSVYSLWKNKILACNMFMSVPRYIYYIYYYNTQYFFSIVYNIIINYGKKLPKHYCIYIINIRWKLCLCLWYFGINIPFSHLGQLQIYRHCPYFYVLCDYFTQYFRAPRFSSSHGRACRFHIGTFSIIDLHISEMHINCSINNILLRS